MEPIAGTVFRLERTSGEGNSVALGLQGICYACSNPLTGSDDEGDGLAHDCCVARSNGCVQNSLVLLSTSIGLFCKKECEKAWPILYRSTCTHVSNMHKSSQSSKLSNW